MNGTDTKQAQLLAVKVQCPNGHVIYESQPQFYILTSLDDEVDDLIKVQISCDSCDINERYFTLSING